MLHFRWCIIRLSSAIQHNHNDRLIFIQFGCCTNVWWQIENQSENFHDNFWKKPYILYNRAEKIAWNGQTFCPLCPKCGVKSSLVCHRSCPITAMHNGTWNIMLHHFFNILNSFYVVKFIVLVFQSRFWNWLFFKQLTDWPARWKIEISSIRAACWLMFVYVCYFMKFRCKI